MRGQCSRQCWRIFSPSAVRSLIANLRRFFRRQFWKAVRKQRELVEMRAHRDPGFPVSMTIPRHPTPLDRSSADNLFLHNYPAMLKI
jgi:hypothetical protein